MPSDPVQLSKFLSFVLRHKPDAIGLTLDSQGWASIDELIGNANVSGTPFNRDDLLRLIAKWFGRQHPRLPPIPDDG